MSNFKVQISDRLFYQVDSKRGKEIAAELKKLREELPRLKEKRNELRDGKYWETCEAHRKAVTLGYSTNEIAEIQNALWKLESEMRAPLKKHNDRCQVLNSEIELLNRPLLNEINEYIEKDIAEVRGLRSARILDSQKRFIDLGDRGERLANIRTVKDNFTSVDKVCDLLVAFKSTIRDMTHHSSSEIIEAVKAFETEVNSIDINATEEREIKESEWNDLKEAKLI